VGQPFYHAYLGAMAEQTPVHLEEYYPPWNRWFENHIYPSPDGLIIVFQDITERKRVEEALRQREQQLASIYDTVGDVIFQPESRVRELSFRHGQCGFPGGDRLAAEQVVSRHVDGSFEPALTLVWAVPPGHQEKRSCAGGRPPVRPGG
jgi:PAS domain-containing protein